MQHFKNPLFYPRSVCKFTAIFALFLSLCIPSPAHATGFFDGLFGPTPEQINAQSDAYVRKVRADTEREIRLEKLDAAMDTPDRRAYEYEAEARRDAEKNLTYYKEDSRYYRNQYDKLSDALDSHKGLLNQYISDLNLFRILTFVFGALATWALGMWLFEKRDRNRDRICFERFLLQNGFRPEHVVNADYIDHARLYPVRRKGGVS